MKKYMLFLLLFTIASSVGIFYGMNRRMDTRPQHARAVYVREHHCKVHARVARLWDWSYQDGKPKLRESSTIYDCGHVDVLIPDNEEQP